jgi:hypothetical protein
MIVSCPAKKSKTNVTPAKAGVQFEVLWIPAFAGMTLSKKAFGFNTNFLAKLPGHHTISGSGFWRRQNDGAAYFFQACHD